MPLTIKFDRHQYGKFFFFFTYNKCYKTNFFWLYILYHVGKRSIVSKLKYILIIIGFMKQTSSPSVLINYNQSWTLAHRRWVLQLVFIVNIIFFFFKHNLSLKETRLISSPLVLRNCFIVIISSFKLLPSSDEYFN